MIELIIVTVGVAVVTAAYLVGHENGWIKGFRNGSHCELCAIREGELKKKRRDEEQRKAILDLIKPELIKEVNFQLKGNNNDNTSGHKTKRKS